MKKQKKAKLSAAVQSIFDDAKKKHDANKEDIDASREHAERAKRVYSAWAKVANFPYSIIEAQYHPAYVKLILALGETLKTEGWQARIDQLTPGSDARQIAVKMLRCALAGDECTLTDLLRQSVKGGDFAYDVDNWLRSSLMNEVLGITGVARSAASEPRGKKPRHNPDEERNQWIRDQSGTDKQVLESLQQMIESTHFHWRKIGGKERIRQIRRGQRETEPAT